jgi:hypothetical protein
MTAKVNYLTEIDNNNFFRTSELIANLSIIKSVEIVSKISNSDAIIIRLSRRSSLVVDLILFFMIFSLLIARSAEQLVTGKVARIL